MEHGISHPLFVFNGPITTVNELKTVTEQAQVPRYSAIAYIQPSLFQSDFGVESQFFSVGFTARHLLTIVNKNFDSSGKRIALQPDELSLVAYILSIALRNGHVVTGEWQEREDACALTESFKGTNDSDLTHAETVELSLSTNRFVPDYFDEDAVVDVERAAE